MYILHNTVYTEIFTRRKNFRQFHHLLSLAKILSANYLSCVNDYIEDMATFIALVKICSTGYFCNTKIAWLGEFFSSKNFHVHSTYYRLVIQNIY